MRAAVEVSAGSGGRRSGAVRAKTVLVVDDDPDNVALLRIVLQLEGHAVTVAADGPAGLDRAASDLPDVVVLDLVMPVMNGLDVLRRLKASPRTAPIPVVVLSAWPDPAAAGWAREAGAAAVASKPIDIGAFADLIQSIA